MTKKTLIQEGTSPSKRFIITGAILLMLASYQSVEAQVVGQEAPEFSYTDLNGTTHKLSDYSGKVVFLFVFGNGCPYCEDIGPATETKVNQVYGLNDDFQALGLDTWTNSTVATVGSFKSKTGINYPLLLQAKSFEQLYSTSYDRVLVIDRKGIIRHKNNTLDTSSDLDNAIAVLESLFLTMDVDEVGSGLNDGLAQAYPNPSADQFQISFAMDAFDRVNIRMYNPAGQIVKQIVDSELPAGQHERTIEVSRLPPGVYFLRMETGGKTWSQKIQVTR